MLNEISMVCAHYKNNQKDNTYLTRIKTSTICVNFHV
mgnify:CR=1 FL=1